MIRRLCRSVLLSFLCVMFLTTSTSAESAWVLWGATSAGWNFQDADTTPSGAFDTKRECERVLSQTVTQLGKLLNHTANREAGVVFTWHGKPPRPSDEAPMLVQSWQCLPDTIDPRGPKGK